MVKDNSKNRKYLKEEKERLIARMVPPENISPSALSFETEISKSTLATWKSKITISSNGSTRKSNKAFSSRKKFLIVMETYTLSESDLAKIAEKMLYMLKKLKNGVLAA